jgi:hypothetical protein
MLIELIVSRQQGIFASLSAGRTTALSLRFIRKTEGSEAYNGVV